MFFTSNNFKSQPSESKVFILFGFSTVRLVPARHVNTAVLPDSNKYIRDGDVGLGRQATVQEVRVRLPDVLEKRVAESDLCDVGKVKLQAFVVPALS